ncbi:unnamed protein product [Zymoseptoria tritici ST99CH_1A5]|nr:unnamed protein product [Zymoseptoria tritici ST99CH_1A5]
MSSSLVVEMRSNAPSTDRWQTRNRINTTSATKDIEHTRVLCLKYRETSASGMPEMCTSYYIYFTQSDKTDDIGSAWCRIGNPAPNRSARTHRPFLKFQGAQPDWNVYVEKAGLPDGCQVEYLSLFELVEYLRTSVLQTFKTHVADNPDVVPAASGPQLSTVTYVFDIVGSSVTIPAQHWRSQRQDAFFAANPSFVTFHHASARANSTLHPTTGGRPMQKACKVSRPSFIGNEAMRSLLNIDVFFRSCLLSETPLKLWGIDQTIFDTNDVPSDSRLLERHGAYWEVGLDNRDTESKESPHPVLTIFLWYPEHGRFETWSANASIVTKIGFGLI